MEKYQPENWQLAGGLPYIRWLATCDRNLAQRMLLVNTRLFIVNLAGWDISRADDGSNYSPIVLVRSCFSQVRRMDYC
jgi:hypothetical protein